MIDYTDAIAGITEAQLQGFFVGWLNPPPPDVHVRLLQASSAAVLAIDADTNQVVGFVTAISDGILSAHITFLEVLPEYQKQGIGSELMQRMLTRFQNLYAVSLGCDPPLQPFYERLGMTPTVGMARINHAHQNGPERKGG